ncbi:hypothetical protein FJN14_12905 [Alteromonas mediterranea]|uniref:hypothetical protein n=1 Tax=Alteromonas mediterranea TaxID=314275 RepID=UPI0011318B5B|nr:hypothetical protein [Alteromonas mediterranea]QDG39305.1 hypothetical protein FJN14_12905 [Alteromonas mediterranea]
MSLSLIMRASILPISLVLILSSCTTRIEKTVNLPAIQAAEEVLDEWGSVTASPPIISIPADEYEFKIDKTAEQFYQSAKEEVNAGILQHTKTVFSFLLAASAQADATTKALYENQLSTYQNAVIKRSQGETLTDDEKEEAKKAKQAMVDSLAAAAKENFTSCKAIADKEDERVAGEISATDAIALNDAAVERRKACLNDYQAELAELEVVSQLPDFPALPENNVPGLSRLQASPFGAKTDISSDAFSLNNGNLSSSLSLPDYNALPQAATNKFLAEMLTTISSNKEKNAYFGVSMISVNPGWRTKEGYHAVVNLDTAVILRDASKATVRKYIGDKNTPDELKELMKVIYIEVCEDDSGDVKEFKSLVNAQDPECVKKRDKIFRNAEFVYPFQKYTKLTSSEYYYDINTTAISPVTYAQTQELQNRQISQINLSLMLAATLQSAGMKESAEAFADFSRQRRKEYGSRSADNNVSVFSTGRLVGLEIQPEFFAANWDDSEPSKLLQQQTFPILLRFDTIGEKQHEELVVAKDCNESQPYCLLEPVISIIPSTRWKSADRSPWLLNSKEQLTTEEQVSLKVALKKECDQYQPTSKYDEKWFVTNKCAELERKLFGEVQLSRLPDKLTEKPTPIPVEFTHIFPQSVKFKKGETHLQDFVLVGKGLEALKGKAGDDIGKKISPVYEGIEVQSATLNGNTITISTKISDDKGPVIFVFDLGDKAISTAMDKDAIASLKAEAPDNKVAGNNPKPETVIKLTVDDNKSISVSLPAGINDLPAHVKEVLMSFYEKPANIFVPKLTVPPNEGSD